MVVQHNMTAINANRYLGINNNKLSKSLEKLSSGYAINRAGDNAAGLAVSEKMRAQIAGINQGVKNAQDGISMIQTFEGALTESDSILQRMRVLAEQSANGTYQDDVDRDAIQLEVDQLVDELNQIADTDFNGVTALNGGVMADGTQVAAAHATKDYNAYAVTPNAEGIKTLEDAVKTAQTGLATAQKNYADDDTEANKTALETAQTNLATAQAALDAAQPKSGADGTATDAKADGNINFTYADADKTDAEGAVSTSNKYNNATASLTYVSSITLQVGARSKDAVNFTFNYDTNGIGGLTADMNASAFGLGLQAVDDMATNANVDYTANGTIDVSSQDSANRAIDVIDNAINKVSMIRSTFGAVQNRLEHKIDNLNVTSENLTSAESRIRDTDMASEMMEFTKNNILAQASQSMLAQANQLPQGVLSLLQ